jgi:hypothetical protein
MRNQNRLTAADFWQSDQLTYGEIANDHELNYRNVVFWARELGFVKDGKKRGFLAGPCLRCNQVVDRIRLNHQFVCNTCEPAPRFNPDKALPILQWVVCGCKKAMYRQEMLRSFERRGIKLAS